MLVCVPETAESHAWGEPASRWPSGPGAAIGGGGDDARLCAVPARTRRGGFQGRHGSSDPPRVPPALCQEARPGAVPDLCAPTLVKDRNRPCP